MRAGHDRSAAVRALLDWMASQDIPVGQAGGLLADMAAVLIAEGVNNAPPHERLSTLAEGVGAFQHDVMLTAMQLCAKPKNDD